MVTFLTSNPVWEEDADMGIVILNESNGFAEVLGQYWQEPKNCLFIASDPSDYEANDRNADLYAEALLTSGMEIACFDLLDDRYLEMIYEQISEYDVLILSGGHIPTERTWFDEIDLKYHLEKFDGILIGVSAGSMNLAEEVFALPEMEGETEDETYDWFFPGLDCAKTSIIPHFQAIYDKTVDGKLMIDELACACSYGKQFLALPDGSYVLVENGVETVFGEAYLISDGKVEQFCSDDDCREIYNYSDWNQKKITVIGAAIVDVLAGPVKKNIFETGSQQMERMKLSFGGDALNEAVVLSRLGRQVELISKVGDDETGARVMAYLQSNHVWTAGIRVEEGLETGMNIVLVDEKGERHFLTNPKSSLRKLVVEDIDPYLDDAADIVSFASMFVSPLLDIEGMEYIFKRIKSKPGRILVVDITKAKRGETLKDLKKLLPYVDYILPNEEEIQLLTGCKDPYKNAKMLVKAGASCAVIKRGRKGCLIRTKDRFYKIPAYPVEQKVDTTGAGDCFAAGFLWALSEGMQIEECGRFACATASCSVEHLGATAGVESIDEPMRRFRQMEEIT